MCDSETGVETGGGDVGDAIGVREVRAALAIRFDPAEGDRSVTRQVTGRLGGTVLRAQVSAARIRPSLSARGDLVLPEVLDCLDKFDLREDFIVVDEPDPLCLVTVHVEADEPLEDVIFASPTGEPPFVVSWGGLRRLTDELLHLATLGLDDLDEQTSLGPLACGDLVGAGVLRLGYPTDHYDLPILPRPALGSWGPSSPAPEDSDPVFGDLVSGRRLLGWVNRYSLRFARGEWAEALVALEASMEAGFAAILDGLLIDHGWESQDLFGAAAPNNAKSTLAAAQSHLGGNWTPVRDDFAELWDMRNRALHRSEYVTQVDVERAEQLTGSFSRLVAERLEVADVARRHPVATYLYSRDSRRTLGTDLFAEVSSAVDACRVDDIRALNDVGCPGRRLTDKAGDCSRTGPALWVSTSEAPR